MQTFKKLPITIPKRKTNMYKTMVIATADMIDSYYSSHLTQLQILVVLRLDNILT